jgi:hypothetical protein
MLAQVKDPEDRYTLAQMAAHPWLDKVPMPAQDDALPSAQSKRSILQVVESLSPAEQSSSRSSQERASGGKGDEPAPPLTPDPGAEGSARSARVASHRLHIEEDLEDTALLESATGVSSELRAAPIWSLLVWTSHH